MLILSRLDKGFCVMLRAVFWRVCAGSGFLAAWLAVAIVPAKAMSYDLVEADLPSCKGACPKVIVASGTIQQNEYALFADFIRTTGEREKLSNMVLLDSAGGFTGGAAALGAVIRKLNMVVLIGKPVSGVVTRGQGLTAGTCASACVIVLAGGAKRFYVKGSRIGVHKSHTGPTVLDPTTRQPVNGKVDHDEVRTAYVQYFRKMGIDQGVVSLIDRTSSDEIYWLSPEELAKFRIARDASEQR